jgi:hypothetical protein
MLCWAANRPEKAKPFKTIAFSLEFEAARLLRSSAREYIVKNGDISSSNSTHR